MDMRQVGTLSAERNDSPISKRASILQRHCAEARASILSSAALKAISDAALAFVDEIHERAHGIKAKPIDAMAYRHMHGAVITSFSEHASRTTLERAASLNPFDVYALMDELKCATDETARRSLDLLLEIAYFKARIDPITTKAHHRLVNSKSADPVLRTRDGSLGEPYCKYCSAPSARYSAFHTSAIGDLTVVRESGDHRGHDGLETPIFHDLNRNLCATHAERDKDKGRDKTAERNVIRMREELQSISSIARSGGLTNLRSLRVRSYVAWTRAKRDVLKQELKNAQELSVFAITKTKIQSLLLDMFGSLGLSDRWLDLTSSLAQIDFCEDGYFVRINHDGSEDVFEVGSASELGQWRDRSQAVFRRLAPILDIKARTDESWLSWLTTMDGQVRNIPIGSLSVLSPALGENGEIVVPRLGFAFRDIQHREPVAGRHSRVLTPHAALHPAPGKVIRLTLLSPDWLAGMFAARRMKPAI